MSRLETPDWIDHLRQIAAPHTVRECPLALGAMEPAFRVAIGADAGPAEPLAADAPPAGEIALWWALVDDTLEPDAALGPNDDGPLLPEGLHRTLEVWTEAELCALHALWKLARRRMRPDLRRRAECARDWHLEHTQPDNATNRPWALHVFLFAGTPEANLYAQTLLHNALVIAGKPEPLSAWILVDAAWELEAEEGSRQ